MVRWYGPEVGVKLNVEASVVHDAPIFGLGYVFKDALGTVLLVACKRLMVAYPITVVEALSILFGLQLARGESQILQMLLLRLMVRHLFLVP